MRCFTLQLRLFGVLFFSKWESHISFGVTPKASAITSSAMLELLSNAALSAPWLKLLKVDIPRSAQPFFSKAALMTALYLSLGAGVLSKFVLGMVKE